MTERNIPDADTDLSGLIEPPIGAIEPVRRRKKTQFWPETTPILGTTPVLPDTESAPAGPADAG